MVSEEVGAAEEGLGEAVGRKQREIAPQTRGQDCCKAGGH